MGTYVYTTTTLLGPRVRTGYLFTKEEIDFTAAFAIRLNAIVEAAVETTRRNDGVPVFYVPSTEFAFQPRHTVCDRGAARSATEPFARSLTSYNGAGTGDVDLLIKAANPYGPVGVFDQIKANKRIIELGLQEMVHPNVAGYEAETLALLRWSRSKAAAEAAAFTRSAGAAKDPPTSWKQSDVRLEWDQQQVPKLAPSTSYPLTVPGFAPSSPLRVVVQSAPRLLAAPKADGAGALNTRVAIPHDLEGGSHTLVVTGTDARGRPRVVRIPFELDRPFRPTVLASMTVGSLVGIVLGLVLLRLTGQTPGIRRRLLGVEL